MNARSESPVPGVVFVLVGVALCVGAREYGVTVDGRMGPGLMPGIAGVALLVLGGVLLREALRQPARSGVALERDAAAVVTDDHEPEAPTGHEGDEEGHAAKPWIILGLIVVALLAAPSLGLIPALALTTIVILRFVERESWRLSLFASLVCLGLSWLVFVELLSVPVPGGVLGLGG